MRALDNWQPWYDDTGAPFYGRMTFYKLHTTDLEEIYNSDGTVALDNPILTSHYGITSQQVFLADEDYTIVMEKYIGPGEMVSDDPDTGHWAQIRVFDNLAPSASSSVPGGSGVVVNAGTMSDLRNIDGNPSENLFAMLLGYYENGDMPPQYYKLVYNSDPGLVDDGGSMIRPSGSTNTVWKLVPQENIDCRIFGVFPTQAISEVNAYSSQLRNCFSYADTIGKDVYMPRVYESISYYWLDGGTYQLGQKVHIDAGARVIGKPATNSVFTVDEIECFGQDLFYSHGSYGGITINCPVVYSRWISPFVSTWMGTVRKVILDGYTSTASYVIFRNCEIEIQKNISGKDIRFDNCTISGNGKLVSCTVSMKDCGYISDSYISSSSVINNLTGNDIVLQNMSTADKYIAWKNMQNEHDYGDIGEQTLHNASIYAPCVLENGTGTCTVAGTSGTGDIELHNFSGTISGDFTSVSFNMLDSWVTFNNTATNGNTKSVSIRRGNISGSALTLLNSSYFEDATIGCILTTPSKAVFKRCDINAAITSFEIDVIDCKISSMITTIPEVTNNTVTFRFEENTFEVGGHHMVTGTNAGVTIVNGFWVNNLNLSGQHFVTLNRDVLDADDTHHSYLYSGNTGPYTYQHDNIKWVDTISAYGDYTQEPDVGGHHMTISNGTIVSKSKMFHVSGGTTDISCYFTEFQMFTVGTENVGVYEFRTQPPAWKAPDPEHGYFGSPTQWVPYSQMVHTQERLWYSSSVGSVKTLAYVGGYTWRIIGITGMTFQGGGGVVIPTASNWSIKMTFNLTRTESSDPLT